MTMMIDLGGSHPPKVENLSLGASSCVLTPVGEQLVTHPKDRKGFQGAQWATMMVVREAVDDGHSPRVL